VSKDDLQLICHFLGPLFLGLRDWRLASSVTKNRNERIQLLKYTVTKVVPYPIRTLGEVGLVGDRGETCEVKLSDERVKGSFSFVVVSEPLTFED
jgi:hypothetical protein